MNAAPMTLNQLRRLAASVGELQGWDFSELRDGRDPVPWDYLDVVRRYLRPTDRVLDVGTGGGLKLLSLASQAASVTGIDVCPAMVDQARANRDAAGMANASFAVMGAEALEFADCSFDLVLNRHSVVHVGEAMRVLREGGYLITQQVGDRNTRSICARFGCGVGGEYGQSVPGAAALADEIGHAGCRVIALAEYDVSYWFLDAKSLLYWLKAIPMPVDFDLARHWQIVARIIADQATSRGIETNEHRELLIAQKA